MRRPLQLLFALLALAGAPTLGAAPEETGAPAERILVTVRNDALTSLHGDAVERYRRPHDYRGDVTIERVLDDLAAEYALQRVSGWPMRTLALHCEVFALAPGASADAIERLAHDPRVDSVQRMNRFRTLGAAVGAGGSYRPLQHSLDELDVDRAHALSRGRGARIAVIDSGIDAAHPDLRGTVQVQRDFAAGPPAAHGTEVAGVIAAQHAIIGIAPEAELLDLRACWGDGNGDVASCDSFSLAQALDFAVSAGVDVINLSLSGPDDPLLTRLLAQAEARAITVVAAAPPQRDAAHAFPGAVHSVILVGMSEDTHGAAGVSAPGVDVLTTFPDGRYDYASGSSLAAAHVSGVVALARALRHRLKPQQVRSLLLAHAPLSAANVLADVPALK